MKRYVVKKSVVVSEYYEVTAESDERAKKVVEYGGGVKFKDEKSKPVYTNLLPDFEPEV